MSSQVCCQSTQWKICHHFLSFVILWITSLKMYCRHPAQNPLSRWSLQFKTIKNCLMFNQSPFFTCSKISPPGSPLQSHRQECLHFGLKPITAHTLHDQSSSLSELDWSPIQINLGVMSWLLKEKFESKTFPFQNVSSPVSLVTNVTRYCCCL